jgi:hypothetical protein
MKKKLSIPEQRRRAAKAAMPEVKRIFGRYGRSAIHKCLRDLHDYEKNLERMAELKSEHKKLEEQIKEGPPRRTTRYSRITSFSSAASEPERVPSPFHVGRARRKREGLGGRG